MKTHRLQKESLVRARKLTKEMLHFWKKRDRELADTKRKKEKLDREMKKRLQEEEEQMMQRRRLEFLMQQSEIYAHFMAAKLGVQVEKVEGRDLAKDDRIRARREVRDIINENRRRLGDF